MTETDENIIAIRESISSLREARGVDETLFQIRSIRKCLSATSIDSREINAVVQSGILDTLVETLSEPSLWTVKAPSADDAQDAVPTLQNELILEATWILTNVASGNSTQTKAVVKAGAMPVLAKLLEWFETADAEDAVAIKDQSVWALGNIIGDGAKLRNLAIENGVVERMIKLLQRFTTIEHLAYGDGQYSLLQNSLWALGNIFRYDAPETGIEIAGSINSLMSKLMDSMREEVDVLCSMCWTTFYIAGCGTAYVQTLVDCGMFRHIVCLFYDERHPVNTAALWAVANFAKSSPQHKSLLLRRWPDLVDRVSSRISIMGMDSRIITRGITFMINFTTECHLEHIQAVINSSALSTIIGIGQMWTNTSHQQSIAQIFSNILAVSESAEIDVLMNSDQFPAVIVKLLKIRKSSIKKSLLEGILKILDSAENMSSPISDVKENLDPDNWIAQLKHVQIRMADSPSDKLVRYIRAFRAVKLPQRIQTPLKNFWLDQIRCELKFRFFDFYKVPDLEQ